MFKRAAVLMVSCVALLSGCGGAPQPENEQNTPAPVSAESALCQYAGEEVCNGVCVSTYDDVENCGSCGMRCAPPGATGVCWYGTCYGCDSNYTNCVAY